LDCCFLAFPDDRLHFTVLILTVIWGIFRRIPSLFSPAVLSTLHLANLMVGFGVRKQMIGQADLFALAIVGVLFLFLP